MEVGKEKGVAEGRVEGERNEIDRENKEGGV